jgi:hypothetical protein
MKCVPVLLKLGIAYKNVLTYHVHDAWLQSRSWQNWYITLVLRTERIEMKLFLLKLDIAYMNVLTYHVHGARVQSRPRQNWYICMLRVSTQARHRLHSAALQKCPHLVITSMMLGTP